MGQIADDFGMDCRTDEKTVLTAIKSVLGFEKSQRWGALIDELLPKIGENREFFSRLSTIIENLHAKNCLIVDDNEDVRKYLSPRYGKIGKPLLENCLGLTAEGEAFLA